MSSRLRPLIFYHGTDDVSAVSIMTPKSPYRHGIDLSLTNALSDFGSGFYATQSLDFAKHWAKMRCRERWKSGVRVRATVISFEVDRQDFQHLQALRQVLNFPRADAKYWNFVDKNHTAVLTQNHPYGVVTGPVSFWPKKITWSAHYDQLCFCRADSLIILPAPTIVAQAPNLLQPFSI